MKEAQEIRAELQKIYHHKGNCEDPDRYGECRDWNEAYEFLLSLGDIYLKSKDAVYAYPKAAAIYQYIKKVVNKHHNGDKEKLSVVRQKISEVEECLVKVVNKQRTKFVDRVHTARCNKGILAEARTNVVKKLEKIKRDKISDKAEKIEEIYDDIREKFVCRKNGIITRFVNDCLKELGNPPRVGKQQKHVKWCIFGMGSMALGTMTPWSDLEFGILIESGLSDHDKKEVKDYFRKFTALLLIKLINLGETPLRMMGISELNDFRAGKDDDNPADWFWDKLTIPGFSPDGAHWHACKLPLGRQGYSNHCDFELIKTSNELVRFQVDIQFQDDLQLLQALTSVISIYGDHELLDKYRKDLYSNHRDIIRSRAIKVLETDKETYNPRFKLICSTIVGKERETFNIKKDLYRFLDRCLLALGQLVGKKPYDHWSSIGKIEDSLLTLQDVDDLKLSLAVVTELRLKAYSENGGQVDDNLNVNKYCHNNRGFKSLHLLLHTSIWLADSIMITSSGRLSIRDDLDSDFLSRYDRGLVRFKLGDYGHALDHFESELSRLKSCCTKHMQLPLRAKLLTKIFYIYCKRSDYEMMERYQSRSIETLGKLREMYSCEGNDFGAKHILYAEEALESIMNACHHPKCVSDRLTLVDERIHCAIMA